MSEFLANPLRVLDRIYRFIEGTTPKAVENKLPIQLVHDVSRQAELGQTGMGFFIAGQDNVHGGASTIEAAFDPYIEVGYLYPNVTELWVWLLNAWVTNLGNTTSASLAIGYVPVGEYIVRRDRLVQYWNVAGIAIFDQNISPAVHTSSCAPIAGNISNFPVLVTPGATCRITTISSGATTIRVEGMFWAGPTGTYPPMSA